MASEYTPNYNLDLYVSTDKPNLRDQYNAAMGKIDTQMKVNADNVTNANANVLTLQTQMTTANENIEALQTEVTENTGTIDIVRTTANEALQASTTNTRDIASLDSTMDSHTQQIAQLVSTTEQQQIQIGGKAPINHSSATTEYGAATTTQYGHTMLDNSSNLGDGVSGKAATSLLVQSMIAQKLTFNNVVHGSMPSNWTGWGGCMMNYDKTLWKFWGSYRINSNTLNLTQIPGSEKYGVKFTLEQPFENVQSYMEFPCCGYVSYISSGQNGQAINSTCGIGIGTDGNLYLSPNNSNTITVSNATAILLTFVQTILTRIDLDIEEGNIESYARMLEQ